MEIDVLHEKFSEYGKHAKEWARKCALLLPEIKNSKVWEKKGFSCIYEYAAKLAGMSRSQVDDALYILEKIGDKPALLQVVEKKGLNAVRPVVSIANAKNEKFLAGKAMEMSHHTLRVFVKGVGREVLAAVNEINDKKQIDQIRDVPTTAPLSGGVKVLRTQVSLKLAERLGKFRNGRSWEETFQKLLDLAEEYQWNQTEKLRKELKSAKPEVVKTESRHIPAKIRQFVLKRAGEKCEFPNCQGGADQLHHVDRFSTKKVHDPDRIVALCHAHHDLAHKGLIENEDWDVEKWKISKEPDYASLNWYTDEKYALYR